MKRRGRAAEGLTQCSSQTSTWQASTHAYGAEVEVVGPLAIPRIRPQDREKGEMQPRELRLQLWVSV